MCDETEIFMDKMQSFLPITREGYSKSVKANGKVLETVVIEDIFMPEIIKLLSTNENSDLLRNIFQYIEELVNGNNSHIIDILSVTMFEILGNDKEILKGAQQYMGPKSIMLQKEVDKELGR